MDDVTIRNELLLNNNVVYPDITTDGYKTFGKGNEIKRQDVADTALKYRINVLVDTLEKFVETDTNGISNLEKFTEQSINNVVKWYKTRQPIHKKVEIIGKDNIGDWGDVTSIVTKKYGHIYAVLNMANAVDVGGGYEKIRENWFSLYLINKKNYMRIQ